VTPKQAIWKILFPPLNAALLKGVPFMRDRA
jgi:hypothetical protein